MIIWLVGPSGAGKTTLARKLGLMLNAPIVDADVYRDPSLGWSKKDRETSCFNLWYHAKELLQENEIVIVSAIAPYKKLRDRIEHPNSYRDIYTMEIEPPVHFIQVGHEGQVGRDDDAEFEDVEGQTFNITL